MIELHSTKEALSPSHSIGTEQRAEYPAVVIVVHPDRGAGNRMAGRVRQTQSASNVLVLSPVEQARHLVPLDADLMLVPLGCEGGSLGFAMSLLPANPWVQAIFVTDGRFCPEAEALRCLGAKHVLGEPEIWSWLPRAIGPLSRRARALRSLCEAERDIPAPSEPAGVAPVLPLPQAEQRFREGYLRVVLARAKSKKAAALLAGVPYTTLRSMVEKLLL